MKNGYPDECKQLGLDSEKLKKVLTNLFLEYEGVKVERKNIFFSSEEADLILNLIKKAEKINPSITVYSAYTENDDLIYGLNLRVFGETQLFLEDIKIKPETLSRFIGFYDHYGFPIFTGDTVAVMETMAFGVNYEKNEVPPFLVEEAKKITHPDKFRSDDFYYWRIKQLDKVKDKEPISCTWLENEYFGYEGEGLINPNWTIVVKRN